MKTPQASRSSTPTTLDCGSACSGPTVAGQGNLKIFNATIIHYTISRMSSSASFGQPSMPSALLWKVTSTRKRFPPSKALGLQTLALVRPTFGNTEALNLTCTYPLLQNYECADGMLPAMSVRLQFSTISTRARYVVSHIKCEVDEPLLRQ